MLTLFEQLDKGHLWKSHGGIHPPELKTLSNTTTIQALPLAKSYWVPIAGLTETCMLAVNSGERVLKGQALTQGLSKGYLPCHAPTSGIFVGVQERMANHASGLTNSHCVIEADDQDESVSFAPAQLSELDDQSILERIRLAGVAGLGGAAFPSHIKLNPVSDIELVIINGIECEPYITSDDRLMREHSDGILQGIEVIHRLLQPKRIIIAIEDNKPEAIEAMSLAINRSHLPNQSTRVTQVPTQYPSGGEKQLIQIITGQEVPSGSIPAQLGVLVHNVGTAYALAKAVLEGEPLIERVVTLTGEGIKNPGNFWVPIGTPIQHILQHGQLEPGVEQVICGGPMMGYTLRETQVPVLKGSNCILVPSPSELAPQQDEKACIRCGECAQVCPAQLLPQQLFWHSKAGEYDKAASYNLRDCIECGSCTYVCPSDIPLVEYYRIAKSALRQEADEKVQAERAKVRFEVRIARLEEEKQAREAKAKQAADRRKDSMTGSDKDKVAEAMARIQAKKKAQADSASTDGEIEAPTKASSTKPNVAAAVARAKAKKAAQQSQSDTGLEQKTDSKQDKIAAAVARAKAKKATLAQSSDTQTADNSSKPPSEQVEQEPKLASKQQPELSSESITASNSAVDDKKARIAAAVARAKAKKAALVQSSDAQTADNSSEPQSEQVEQEPKLAVKQQPELSSESVTASNSTADDKKARIAAAVARAKAKKAAQSTSQDGEQTDVDESPQLASSTEDNAPPKADDAPVSASQSKQDRIAAAVAKAKAKKAQKLSQGER